MDPGGKFLPVAVIKVSPSPPSLGEIESKLVYDANYKSPTLANPI